MSRADDAFVGLNWGGSNLRGFLIAADGTMIDDFARPRGVLALTRDEIEAEVATVHARWPKARAIYASGMIGSNIGWVEAPYLECPAAVSALSSRLTQATMAGQSVWIVPGLTCTDGQGRPDIMRGEELELFGLLEQAQDRNGPARRHLVLPGTHTKWVRLAGDRVEGFFTSMAGELFDRVSERGALASVLEGPGHEGEWRLRGVDRALTSGLTLASLLFEVRAGVVRGAMPKAEAASYLRGLLVGTEILDALARDPSLRHAKLELVGASPVTALYQSALNHAGMACVAHSAQAASIAGFFALHRAAMVGAETSP